MGRISRISDNTTSPGGGLDDLDLPDFGYLFFDGYVAAKWDPDSPLTKDQQKRSLVESWLSIGRYGRTTYSDEDILWPTDGHPAYIPQDLLSEEDRKMDGQITRTIWIRTWFGKKDDPASQEAADAAYERLVIDALRDGEEDASWDAIEPGFVFDSKEEFGHNSHTTSDENGDPEPDVVDGIALGRPGSVPSYLVTAMMHCPGQLDGNNYSDWRQLTDEEVEAELPEQEKTQNLLVCVADRKACEEGLVLFLAINHRGKILPFRMRDQASEVSIYEGNWLDGQALDENTNDRDNDEEYLVRHTPV